MYRYISRLEPFFDLLPILRGQKTLLTSLLGCIQEAAILNATTTFEKGICYWLRD